MKLFKKIDLFYLGDYVCSTKQSRTCKEAVRRYLETIETRSHQLGSIGLVEIQILKNPEHLKAGFDKDEVRR
jgi:hypothetical protein